MGLDLTEGFPVRSERIYDLKKDDIKCFAAGTKIFLDGGLTAALL